MNETASNHEATSDSISIPIDSNFDDTPGFHMEARKRLNQFGFVIFSSSDTSEEWLLKFASKFGYVQLYRDDIPDPILRINSEQSESAMTSSVQASGPREFLPHTDGCYLPDDESSIGLGPPSLVLLQCITEATVGGETLLIDSSAILSALGIEHLDNLKLLLNKGGVVFQKGTVKSNHHCMFVPNGNGRWTVRFRLDLMSVIAPMANVVKKIAREFLPETALSYKIKLAPGQVILVDNHRVLHGRKPIELGPRIFRRLWINCLPGVSRVANPFSVRIDLDNRKSDPIMTGLASALLDSLGWEDPGISHEPLIDLEL